MTRNDPFRPDSEYAAVLTGVSHRHTGRSALSLSGIDLIVRHGERVAVIGPSGAGKSTLLTLLDGRLKGWTGGAMVLSTALDPQHPPDREQRARTGFIFQEFALVERETARVNVLNGRLGRVSPLASLFRRFSAEDHAKADAALTDAGIAEVADHRVDQLSGGQRQRVAIARCLAQEPALILADEPVSNLDPPRAESILRLLGDLARKRGAALLFSSHQPDLALRHADRVVALDGGAIVYDGAPEGMDRDALDRLYAGEDQMADEPGLRLVS